MKPWLVSIFVIFCSAVFAQTATIKGSVIDASTGEPLPFGNVFINSSTLGTTSDKQGNFELKNVPMPGTYEVIISYVGYESYAQKINVSDGDVTVRVIKLKPSETLLNDVEVKTTRDKDWEKKMKRFTKTFLGNDDAAKQCTILNPWVVDFQPGKDPDILVAHASQPIWIENKALGYKLRFILLNFSSSLTEYSINGKSFFEEMKSDDNRQIQIWRQERDRSYRNSKQYLFKSIIERRIRGEGFELYSDIQGARNSRSQFFYREELGTTVLPTDTTNLVDDVTPQGLYTIRLPRRLEIHNLRERDNSSIYRDVLHPVSWIESKTGLVVVNKDGFETNTSDAVVRGSISNIRLSRLMPTDYKPVSKNTQLPATADFGFLHEKIYVQTDKPYYYPGEIVWFKGYIKYRSLTLKDSLSTTVYCELIGPTKKIVMSRMLEIVDGSFDNEFILPDTLRPGDYYLRCYTTLNRNFGDDHLYTKYIPVLGVKQTVDVTKEDTTTRSNGLVIITSSKDRYSTTDAIELTLSSNDSDQDFLPGAHLSVSVIDTRQVSPVNVDNTIVDEFESEDTTRVKTLAYPIEYGFEFNAHYEDSESSNTELLNVFQLQPRIQRIAQADFRNNFSIDGLTFYDSASFFVVPVKKGKSEGTTTLLPRPVPPVSLPAHVQLAVVDTDIPHVVHYKTDEVTVLKEITVKSTRIRDTISKKIYGRPERVISGDDIRSTKSKTLFQALQTPEIQKKLNGVWIKQFFDWEYQTTRWYIYLSSGIGNRWYGAPPSELIITINDKIVTGLPENILSKIFLSNVTSIAVYRRPHTIYGNSPGISAAGVSNGVLSIYTNTDEWIDSAIDRSKNVLVYGYKRPAVFQPKGSIVFWKPDVKLDDGGKAQLAFKADLPGQYKVTIEGLATNGTPLRAEKTIIVEDQ
jgi:hypothetical protein